VFTAIRRNLQDDSSEKQGVSSEKQSAGHFGRPSAHSYKMYDN